MRRVVGVGLAVVLTLGGLVSSRSTGGAAAVAEPTPVSTWTSFAAAVTANAIAFDATRNKLLAAVPGTVPGLGNEVVELNPSTGALERSVYVGPQPNALAVSTDGTTLYVGFKDTNRILRVNLATFKVGSGFSLGGADEREGPNYTTELAVAPGDDNVVIAALHTALYSGDFLAYNRGVALGHEDTFPGQGVESFAFGANASTLYAFDDRGDIGTDLVTWQLDSVGVRRTHTVSGLLEGYTGRIKFAGGRVYAASGAIIDPASGTLLTTIPVLGGAVAPVPAASRVYYLSGAALKEYRSDTFALVSSKNLALAATPNGVTGDLLPTNAGVAVLRRDGSLYLAGPGIGPRATIAVPAVPDHVSNLVRHEFANRPLAAAVNDPFTGKILGAVPSTAGANANEVVEIDPVTGTVGRHVLAGSDPGLLALSDDGTILYVGLKGTNRIATVALANFTNTGSFPLDGPSSALSLAVRPGSPGTVAVLAPGLSLQPDAIAIYDSGIRRPTVFAPTSACLDSIAFGNASTLFATEGGCSPAAFYVLSLDALGPHLVRSGNEVGRRSVIGTVSNSVFLECNIVTPAVDVVARYPECINAIDPLNNRVYEFEYPDGTLSEYELGAMRSVKTVGAANEMDDPSDAMITSVGFAFPEFQETLTLLVHSSFTVSVSWSPADAARIAQIGAFKGWTPAQVQKNAVALVAYVKAFSQPPKRTPWKPTPLGTPNVITSTWLTSELPALKYVGFMYSASDVNAVRLSVTALSYALALQGH